VAKLEIISNKTRKKRRSLNQPLPIGQRTKSRKKDRIKTVFKQGILPVFSIA